MTRPAKLTPAPLPDFDPAVVVDLDVRDELRAGREPLAAILAAAESLPAGGVLHLRSPFQPTPLFMVLSRLGFAYHAAAFADDDWSSWFWRGELPARSTPAPASWPGPGEAWDLRGLPPPEPLEQLLSRVARDAQAFDVVLPGWSDMIAGLLADRGWRAVVTATTPSAVQVRVSPVDR